MSFFWGGTSCIECKQPVGADHHPRACGNRVHWDCEQKHLEHCVECRQHQPEITYCRFCNAPAELAGQVCNAHQAKSDERRYS